MNRFSGTGLFLPESVCENAALLKIRLFLVYFRNVVYVFTFYEKHAVIQKTTDTVITGLLVIPANKMLLT